MLARHSLSMHFSLCLCLNASMHTSFEASVEHAIQDAKAGTFCRNLRVSTTYRQSTCVNPERKTRLDAILFRARQQICGEGSRRARHERGLLHTSWCKMASRVRIPSKFLLHVLVFAHRATLMHNRIAQATSLDGSAEAACMCMSDCQCMK